MKLALGTVQFGLDYGVANMSGRVPMHEANAILLRAKACGMDTLDTAIAYGNSEVVLGQLGIDDWKIVTKLPVAPSDCKDLTQWIFDQIQQSMTRLRVTRLYGVLLHRPSQLLEDMGFSLYDALQSIKSAGWTQKIGVSIYDPAELDPLFNTFTFDIVQAPLSILDRSLVESGWAGKLKSVGVEIHTRSAFLQGLLLMKPHQRPAKFNRWNEVWHVWDSWLEKEELTPLEGCLRYLTHLPTIDRVLVGVDSVEQLNQIIKAVDGELVSLPQFDALTDQRIINPATWSQL